MKSRTLLGAMAATAFCLSNSSAFAQSFSDADFARVAARIDQFERTVSSGDFASVMEFVPPVMFQKAAQDAGMTESQLLQVMRQLVRTQASNVTVLDYELDLAAASPALTPDGLMTYLIIPTTTLMEIEDGRRARTRNHTLALKEEGEWYLIRVNDAAQVDRVRELWPSFAAVDFPAGTIEYAD